MIIVQSFTIVLNVCLNNNDDNTNLFVHQQLLLSNRNNNKNEIQSMLKHMTSIETRIIVWELVCVCALREGWQHFLDVFTLCYLINTNNVLCCLKSRVWLYMKSHRHIRPHSHLVPQQIFIPINGINACVLHFIIIIVTIKFVFTYFHFSSKSIIITSKFTPFFLPPWLCLCCECQWRKNWKN